VVAGHGRLAAARQLGLSEVPVVPLRGLTELQRRQLVLADNRIALNAGWDLEMLRVELTDLSALGADLSTLGFTPKELAAALTPAGALGLTDEDEVPELAQAAVTRIGDVWCLGTHRVACGDSTHAAKLCIDADPRKQWGMPIQHYPTWPRPRKGTLEVGFWPEADPPTCLLQVRFRRRSGLVILSLSSSASDPKLTSTGSRQVRF
jgi:hypothetical protein